MMFDRRFVTVLTVATLALVGCVTRENAPGTREQAVTAVSTSASAASSAATRGPEGTSSAVVVAAASAPMTDEKPWVEPTRDVTTPLQIVVRGPATVAGNDEFDVTVDLVRSVAGDTPIELAVTVPAGARLVSGKATETILDPTHTTVSRTLRLKVDRVPEQDLSVVAEMKGSGFGVNARGAYRFGRPEEKLPEVHVQPRNKKKLGGGIQAN